MLPQPGDIDLQGTGELDEVGPQAGLRGTRKLLLSKNPDVEQIISRDEYDSRP